jgi:hypothetical protein
MEIAKNVANAIKMFRVLITEVFITKILMLMNILKNSWIATIMVQAMRKGKFVKRGNRVQARIE